MCEVPEAGEMLVCLGNRKPCGWTEGGRGPEGVRSAVQAGDIPVSLTKQGREVGFHPQ